MQRLVTAIDVVAEPWANEAGATEGGKPPGSQASDEVAVKVRREKTLRVGPQVGVLIRNMPEVSYEPSFEAVRGVWNRAS